MRNDNIEYKLAVLLRDSEDNGEMLNEQLTEMSLENDQLYGDYCKLYDAIVKMSTRIEMVKIGYSDPETTLDEMRDIIYEVIG